MIEDGTTPVELTVCGEPVTVAPGPEVIVPLADHGPRLSGEPQSPIGTVRGDGTVISAIVPSGD